MSILANPVYRIESHGRGPQNIRDVRGWLLGRGGLARLLRLLPLVAVVGSIAAARATWPEQWMQSAAHMAAWTLPVFIASMAVLAGSSMATGRDWQQERMQEWVVAPMERPALVAGKVWGWALPPAIALTAGSLLAALVWALSLWRGWGVPLFAPTEGLFAILEAWATLFLMASLGVWAGNMLRRPWPALMISLLLGLVFQAAIIAGLFFTVDLARLGGHLMLIGGAWFLASFFHGWSERRLK